jgi:hypothetical protein
MIHFVNKLYVDWRAGDTSGAKHMLRISLLLLLANFLTMLINCMILGLNFKLYTEYFKDKSQDQRILKRGESKSGAEDEPAP